MARIARVVVWLIGLAAAGSASAQMQPGGYFVLEGGKGYRFTDPVVPFVAQPEPQFAPGDTVNDWTIPDLSGHWPWFGRVEFGGVGTFSSRGLLQFGVHAAGWYANDAFADESLFGLVTCKPGPIPKSECEIQLCLGTPVPCGGAAAAMRRYYWEVASELAVGVQTRGAARLFLGAQPFYGQFGDTISFEASGGKAWTGALDGQLFGGLAVLGAELDLSERARLFLMLGGGMYQYEAEGLFDGGGSPLPSHLLSGTGLRGQAALGVTVDVGERMSIGLVGRADYFSAFPGLTVPQSGIPFCMFAGQVSICEPPKVEGTFGAEANPLLNVYGGLRIGVKLGGG